tara:strand:+ start:2379 stop:2582 length:204 start_codon:yes stop_codon:yes gene_type:complete
MANIIASISKFPHGYVYGIIVEQVEVPPLIEEYIEFTFPTNSITQEVIDEKVEIWKLHIKHKTENGF